MSCQGEIEAAQPVATQGVSTCSVTSLSFLRQWNPLYQDGDETRGLDACHQTMPSLHHLDAVVQRCCGNVMHDAATAPATVALVVFKAAGIS